MTDTHNLHLPNEILYEIVDYVADEDILNLRLSASVFQYITADRFAATFFENRAYDVSAKGLKALVKITEHPSFARHIGTIIISHGGRFTLTRHNNYLEQAFQNLAAVGNTISLGLRQVRKCRQYHRDRSRVLNDTIEFFRRKVSAAAVHARMPLGDFVADTQSASQNRVFPSVSEDWVREATRQISRDVVDHNQFSGLKIKLSSTDLYPSRPGYILIRVRDKRLEVSQVGTLEWQHYLPHKYQRRLREIILEDCYVNGDWLLSKVEASGRTLERLSLYNVRLQATSDGRFDTWMSLFAASTTFLRVLSSCKLGDLWDETNGRWLEGGDKTIEANTKTQVSTVLSNLAVGVRTFTLDA
jgi:hypothetical protein